MKHCLISLTENNTIKTLAQTYQYFASRDFFLGAKIYFLMWLKEARKMDTMKKERENVDFLGSLSSSLT